jgi:hypothetical protein
MSKHEKGTCWYMVYVKYYDSKKGIHQCLNTYYFQKLFRRHNCFLFQKWIGKLQWLLSSYIPENISTQKDVNYCCVKQLFCVLKFTNMASEQFLWFLAIYILRWWITCEQFNDVPLYVTICAVNLFKGGDHGNKK